jgi:hypothetical protein
VATSKSGMHVTHYSAPDPTLRRRGALPGVKLFHWQREARFAAKSNVFRKWLSVLKCRCFCFLLESRAGITALQSCGQARNFTRPYFVADAVVAGTFVAAPQ